MENYMVSNFNGYSVRTMNDHDLRHASSRALK